jgi:hypothetical protein
MLLQAGKIPIEISNSIFLSESLKCAFFRVDPLLDFYSVGYLWYTPIAVFTVLIVGLIVSYATHPLKPHEIDPKLIIPVDDIFCCFLPERWRKWLRCGVNYDPCPQRNVSFRFFSKT